MGKYCPAGKIECENFTVYGVPSCLEIKPSARIYHHIEKYDTYCPWPSRQVRAKPEIVDIDIHSLPGYDIGRSDMKREIGDKVEGLNRFGTGSDDFVEREDMIAAMIAEREKG